MQDALAAAVRALDFNLLNVSHVQRFRELFVAILAKENVSRHDHPLQREMIAPFRDA